MDKLFEIVDAEVGFGNVATGGSLGYDCPETGGLVATPFTSEYQDVISAHAPSLVTIDVQRAVGIAGASNATYSGTPVRCWINDHQIGMLSHASQRTPYINLPRGRYVLEMDTMNRDGNCKHTLWLVRETPDLEQDRLAVVTVGCYSRHDLADELRWLFASAAKHGMLVHVEGVNEPFGNFYTRKVECVFERMAALPDVYSHAIYVDGRDAMILASESEIKKKLDMIGGSVIGTESCSWPLDEDEEWAKAFTGPTEWVYPQAGNWGGRLNGIGSILETLVEVMKLHYRLKHGTGPGWLYKPDGSPRYNPWDDQFMWQALVRSGYEPLKRDMEWSLFACPTCTGVDVTNPRYKFHSGRLIVDGYRAPCAIHLSGAGKRFMNLWGHFLEAEYGR